MAALDDELLTPLERWSAQNLSPYSDDEHPFNVAGKGREERRRNAPGYAARAEIGQGIKSGLVGAEKMYRMATDPNFKEDIIAERKQQRDFFSNAGTGTGSTPETTPGQFDQRGALGEPLKETETANEIRDKYADLVGNPELSKAIDQTNIDTAADVYKNQVAWVSFMANEGATRDDMIRALKARDMSPQDMQVAMAEIDRVMPEAPPKPYEVRDTNIENVAQGIKNIREGKGDTHGNVKVDPSQASATEGELLWQSSKTLGNNIAIANNTKDYWYQDDDFVNSGLLRMGLGLLMGEEVEDAWKAASEGYQNSVNRKRRSAYAQELQDMGYAAHTISDYIETGKLDENARTIELETATDKYGNVYHRNPFTKEIKKAYESPNTYKTEYDSQGNRIGQFDKYGKYDAISRSGTGSDKSVWSLVPGTDTTKPFYRDQFGNVKSDPSWLDPSKHGGGSKIAVKDYFGDGGNRGQLGTADERKSFQRTARAHHAARGIPQAWKEMTEEMQGLEGNLIINDAVYEGLMGSLARGSSNIVGGTFDAIVKKHYPKMASYLTSVMNTLMPMLRDDSGATITDPELLREFQNAQIMPTDWKNPEIISKKMDILANNLLNRFALGAEVTPLGAASAKLLEAIDQNQVGRLSIGNDGIWFEDITQDPPAWVSMKEAYGITRPKMTKEFLETRKAHREEVLANAKQR